MRRFNGIEMALPGQGTDNERVRQAGNILSFYLYIIVFREFDDRSRPSQLSRRL